jgi:hypothetical protein
MKNNVPDVKDLLKALQLTIEFEGQLIKRYDKHVCICHTNMYATIANISFIV